MCLRRTSSKHKNKGQDAKKNRDFEAIFQEENELKEYIIPNQLESALKYLSKGIKKSTNGFLDQKIKEFNVGRAKVKIMEPRKERNLGRLELRNSSENEFPKYLRTRVSRFQINKEEVLGCPYLESKEPTEEEARWVQKRG